MLLVSERTSRLPACLNCFSPIFAPQPKNRSCVYGLHCCINDDDNDVILHAMLVIIQVNVLYLLPAWLGKLISHPLVKTHPIRSSLTVIVYGTPHVPFKYKRRIHSAGFRDVIYGKMSVAGFHCITGFHRFTVACQYYCYFN